MNVLRRLLDRLGWAKLDDTQQADQVAADRADGFPSDSLTETHYILVESVKTADYLDSQVDQLERDLAQRRLQAQVDLLRRPRRNPGNV